MRCQHCGRAVKHLRTARGPQGKLLFDWCQECLDLVHRRVLLGGLSELDFLNDAPARHGQLDADEALVRSRVVALRVVGLLLSGWGIVLVIAGCLQPHKIAIFGVGGAVLIVSGALLALISLRPDKRRRVALGLEILGLCLGLAGLGFGIAFHDTKRNAWIVAFVLLDALVIRSLRIWTRNVPASIRAATLQSGPVNES